MHLAKKASDYRSEADLRLVTTSAFSPEAVIAMLRCGLTWYWKSSHTEGTVTGQPEALPRRSVSHLIRNSRVLIRDLEEVVGNGSGAEYRNLVICGVTHCLESPLRANMKSVIVDFLYKHLGPVQMLMIRKSDRRGKSILFYEDAFPEVKYLLDHWHQYIMTPPTRVSQQDLEALYRTVANW
jgi:hypothetical protein